MNSYVLGDLLEVTSSKRVHAKDYVDEGIPFYRSKEAIKLSNNEKIINPLHISKQHFEIIKSKYNVPEIGDILLTSVGTIGIPFYVKNPIFYFKDGNLTWFRNFNSIINSKFLYYWMKSKSFTKQIKNNNIGAVQKALTIDFLKTLKIDIPIKQHEIALFLSNLDQKIELNNKINAELEAMAKLIYDYWFVQFDFPNSEGKPYKSSGGKMVYNAELKREIPESWEVKKLSQIANITMGQSPSGSSYNDSAKGTIFFQGSTDFGWRFPSVREYTTEPSRLAKVGDILLSVRAPVGTLNIANNDCCIGRGLAALTSKNGNNSFLFYVMLYFKQIFDRRNMSGTTFGSITKEDLFSLKLVYPTSDILDKYCNRAADFNLNIFYKHQQNQQLTELRDWLLPMLMNGQVTVK